MVYRFADGKADRLPALAAKLVHLQVDVMVIDGTAAIRAAKHTTTTIPIVMAASGDPVGAGCVASLARPGGNISGLSFQSDELSGKWLEILKEAVPQIPVRSRLSIDARSCAKLVQKKRQLLLAALERRYLNAS